MQWNTQTGFSLVFVLSNNWKDLLAGIVVAVVLKVLVWQKQADAKKLRKASSMVQPDGEPQRISRPYMSEDSWMNIPLTANRSTDHGEQNRSRPKYDKKIK